MTPQVGSPARLSMTAVRLMTKPVAAYAAYGRSGETGANWLISEAGVQFSKRCEPAIRSGGRRFGNRKRSPKSQRRRLRNPECCNR